MRLGIAASLAGIAIALALVFPTEVTATSGCVGATIDLAGVGPACRTADGLWQVELADGSTVRTHGPDHTATAAPREDEGVFPAVPGLPPPRAPECVASAAEPHGLLVYARPFDTPDRSAEMADQIRLWFSQANGILSHAAATTAGYTATYRMLCSSPGVPAVAAVVLPTSKSSDSWGSIVGELKSKGYKSSSAKYWVLYDGTVSCNCSGLGTTNSDDRPIDTNANNRGPSYGVVFIELPGSYAAVMAHENGHNLGAVQHSAPHSSGAFHCNDGSDIMCYNDGGPRSQYVPVFCPGTRPFDCNGDDYFNPAPGPANYLATHWNIGSTMNRYLHVSSLQNVPGPTVLTGDATAGGILTWSPPALTGSSSITGYRLYRQQAYAPFAYPLEAELPATTRQYPAKAGTWWITAVNAAGEGPISNWWIVTA